MAEYRGRSTWSLDDARGALLNVATAASFAMLCAALALNGAAAAERSSPCPIASGETLHWLEAPGKDDGRFGCILRPGPSPYPVIDVAYGIDADAPSGEAPPKLPGSLAAAPLPWGPISKRNDGSYRSVTFRAAPNQLDGPWWLVTISIWFQTQREFERGENLVRSLVFPAPSSNYRLERP